MTKPSVLCCIIALVLYISTSHAQPSGGFIDSSLDSNLREANVSDTIYSNPGTEQTIFWPYNTKIRQVNIGCEFSASDALYQCAIGGSATSINNAIGYDTMLILSQIKKDHAVRLYSYNKQTGVISSRGEVFMSKSYITQFYFSHSDPFRFYGVDDEGDLLTMKSNSGIVDKAATLGKWKMIPGDDTFYLTQTEFASTSADDKVHALFITILYNNSALGCAVTSHTGAFMFFRQSEYMINCKVDLSGEYIVIQEKYSNVSSEAKNGTLRIIKLADQTEQIVLSKGYEFLDNAWDVGYRSIIIAERNYAAIDKSSATEPVVAVGGYLLYAFTFADTNTRNLVYANNDKDGGPQEITWRNAKDGVPLEQQFACGSSHVPDSSNPQFPPPNEYSRKNEIICFKLDASLSGVLVLSPTNLADRAHFSRFWIQLDPSGRYLAWTPRTTFSAQSMISIFASTLMEIPYHLLMPPYVAESMVPIDYFNNTATPFTFAPEVPVPDTTPATPGEAGPIAAPTIEPWAWAVGAALLAVVLGAWIVFAIFFIRYKFRIAQRQR